MKYFEDQVYYSGRVLRVIWARRANGTFPARGFFDGLSVPDKARIDRILVRLADEGRIFNKQHYRKIHCEEDLWEVKGGAARMVCFTLFPSHLAIVCGFKKRGGGKSEQLPKGQIDKAIQIKKEFQEIFERMKCGELP